MKMLHFTAALSLAIGGFAGSAYADPGKDESGKGRWRGGYERSYGPEGRYGRGYEGRDPRSWQRDARERRAFKQEYDDGTCKYERKLEKSGEYKEEVKCRSGRRTSFGGGYRY